MNYDYDAVNQFLFFFFLFLFLFFFFFTKTFPFFSKERYRMKINRVEEQRERFSSRTRLDRRKLEKKIPPTFLSFPLHRVPSRSTGSSFLSVQVFHVYQRGSIFPKRCATVTQPNNSRWQTPLLLPPELKLDRFARNEQSHLNSHFQTITRRVSLIISVPLNTGNETGTKDFRDALPRAREQLTRSVDTLQLTP